ncbi:MAG: hypothetical protein R3F03_01390 [Opitutaceae bacterium]
MITTTESSLRIVMPPTPPAAGPTAGGWRKHLLFVGMAGGGAAVGYLAARWGFELFLPVPHKGWLLALLAMLPFAWLVTVGFHEFGHLTGGWLTGGRFLLWVVGPLMIRRTPSGVRLALNRSVNLAGGMAACVPLDTAALTPRRVAVMILGGPLASVVLAVGMIWISAGLAARTEPGLGVILLQHFVTLTAGLSLMIFLVTVWPATAQGFKTDGRRVFELLRGDDRSDQEAATMALTTATLAGVRPAEFDPRLVDRAVALDDGSLFDLYGQLSAYYFAADQADWPAAQARLDRLVAGEAKLAPYVRDLVRCEYAWLLVSGAKAAKEARAWLDSAGPLDFDPATRLRVEAAVLLEEGSLAEASSKAATALQALRQRSLSPVENAFNRQAIDAVLHKAAALSPSV